MIRSLLLSGAIGACMLHGAAVQAAGVLRLTHNVITLGGTQPAAKLEVENTGDSPLYLDISQELVQSRVGQSEIRRPAGEVSAPSLLVNPLRLVLRPGQKRALDVTELYKPRQQQIWRVTFRPRERYRVQTDGERQEGMPLLVSVGYGAVIYQQGSAATAEQGEAR